MPPLQSARARAGRVLLASSSPHTQATLRAMLAGCDAVTEIHEAWSLPEACGLSRAADLVLFEATEAGRLGVTAALEGLRAAGAPAVIVVAADSDPEVGAQRRCDAGAISFALTWSDLRALHATVAAALDGQGLVAHRGRRARARAGATAASARSSRASRSPSRPRTASPAATCARSRELAVQLARPDRPGDRRVRRVPLRLPPARRRQDRRPRADPLQARPARPTTSGSSCAATPTPARGSWSRSACRRRSSTSCATTTSAGTGLGTPTGWRARRSRSPPASSPSATRWTR